MENSQNNEVLRPPIEAKVFLAEDNEIVRKATIRFLKSAGHQVVAVATTKDEALAMIPNLDELGVTVAVIDGNLRENVTDGRDGEEIVKAIKEIKEKENLEIRILGFSGSGDVNGADLQCHKEIKELVEMISNS